MIMFKISKEFTHKDIYTHETAELLIIKPAEKLNWCTSSHKNPTLEMLYIHKIIRFYLPHKHNGKFDKKEFSKASTLTLDPPIWISE